ncbi:PucR family transcriptional regulator [Nocardiopsis changdeensis]|uniref:Helix-turn-helix domain-containing protein n=1 Tax=Nocardiopsis changdeensis TaxID=2831969 RepID=A0ABX8BVC9_9ACTN|nr:MULTISPECIES: helix-turn-helix domain-containing protein [Nocardiopsis]QUX24718.1 helix-turn-helix domain-containing protein [Nocardiopsis changdeensis]QYX35105.1 helix-turn-helix domain-containing protein [Nocardiopsis sp. MT53]
MTRHKSGGVPMIGGRPAHTWIAPGDPALVDEVIASFTATNPDHHGDGARSLAPDIRWVVEHNLRLCVSVLRRADGEAGDTLGPDDAELLAASAARRAAEGASLESLLDAYHRGFSAVWDRLHTRAGPGDLDALARVAALFIAHLGRITTVVARGYLDEREHISGDEQGARFALYSALVSGADPGTAARRAGVPLPDSYLVLSLSPTAPPAQERGVSEEVARRRRAHRLRRELEAYADGPVLALLGGGGGTALVPLPADADGAPGAAELVARLGGAAGAPVTAGGAVGPPERVPDLLALADELQSLARALDRPAGLYMLDDLLFEYQATRPGAARALLAALLDPLAGHPDLYRTLEEYLGSDGDRRGTAARLHVHPNTVDYRLGRAAALLGLDLSRESHRSLAAMALAARRVDASR